MLRELTPEEAKAIDCANATFEACGALFSKITPQFDAYNAMAEVHHRVECIKSQILAHAFKRLHGEAVQGGAGDAPAAAESVAVPAGIDHSEDQSVTSVKLPPCTTEPPVPEGHDPERYTLIQEAKRKIREEKQNHASR